MAQFKKKTAILKRKWVKIVAPQEFGGSHVGETYVAEPQEAIGRVADVNLATISNENQRQQINLGFTITGVKEGRLTTELTTYYISPSSIRRFTRKKKAKIEDSFTATTSDGNTIRIKPLLLTKSKARGNVLAAIRKALRKEIINKAASMRTLDFFQEILSRKLQKEVSAALKKLYPISSTDFKHVGIVSSQKGANKREENLQAPEIPAEAAVNS